MFTLGRFVQIFIYPDNWAAIGLLVTFYLLWKKKRNWALRVAIASLLLVIIPSIPIVAWGLMHTVEKKYPSQPIDSYPTADAILVLGGTVAQVLPPRHEPEEIGGSRLLPAVRLFRNHKAKWIVVSGGAPYVDPLGKTRTQALDMKVVLEDMGVPAANILLQDRSRNTEEDIKFSAELLGTRKVKKVLLVTSAFHMKRAMTFAAKTPFEWIAVPTGHEAVEAPLTMASFIPGWGYLKDSDRVIKELVGLQYAKIRSR